MSTPPKPTILVTGAAGGIGTGFVHAHLASPQAVSHHTIYIIHPSAPGSLAEILRLHSPKGSTYEIIPLDLSSMRDIRLFAKGVKGRIERGELGRIDVLLLIAGAMFLDKRAEDGVGFTGEGVEMTFAVNYVANFLL